MDGTSAKAVRMLTALLLCAVSTAGCASWRVPRIDPSGRHIFLPCEETVVVPVAPIVPGIPVRQEKITVTPSQIIAPVGSEVVMLANVLSPKGDLMAHKRVEWMLAPNGAGSFVTMDRNGCLHPMKLLCGRPRKVTNTYAIGSTSSLPWTISRGTPDPADDVNVQRGQSWISVTSPSEGTSHVTAYAPVVKGWDQRTAAATIHWVDAQWVFPPPSVNPLGEKHVFTTIVSRHTDNTPLEGWIVRYEIVGGPAAGFAPDGSEVVEIRTNELGQASTEIFQKTPQGGSSRIGIQIIRPARENSPRLILGTGVTTKSWTAPDLALRTSGPSVASVGGTMTYLAEISNPGDLPADQVVLSAETPAGLSVVSSNPPGQTTGATTRWNVATLGARGTQVFEITYRANQPGTVNHCFSARTGAGLTASDCVATTVVAPTLDVQVRGPETTAVGQIAQFEVTVTNKTEAPATGLLITDQYDTGLQHAIGNNPIERDLGDIAPGTSRSIRIEFRVTQAGPQCHTVTVTGQGGLKSSARACVTGVQSAVQPQPPTQPQPTEPPKPPVQPQPPAGEPALKVNKTGPKQLKVGETAEFIITIENSGEVPLTGIEISDTYDLALDPTFASEGFTPGRDELVWKLARLEVGQVRRLQVNCECVAAVAQACNRVSVKSDQLGPIGADSCLEITPKTEVPNPGTSATTPPSNLELTITDLGDPVKVGTVTNYRIFVNNKGQTSDKAVRLVVTLPVEMSASRFGTKAPARHTIDGKAIRFEAVAEIRAGETLTYTIPVEAKGAGTVRVIAEVTSDGLTAPLKKEETTQILAP